MTRVFKLASAMAMALTTSIGLISIAAAADKTEIKIGYALSQTGPASGNSLELQRSYDLWREQVNADGGLFVKDLGKKLPITFVAYDDKSDASTSTKLYERLITVDDVDLLLSPWGSGINFAVAAITEKHEKNLIMASASSDAIYARGYKYIFQATELASGDAVPLSDLLIKKKDTIKSVAILTENNLFAETVANSLDKLVEGKGVNIVMKEKFPAAGQSFAAPLTKAKALNPDGLIVFALPPATIYATRQAYEVGVLPKFFYVLAGPQLKEYMDALGKQAEGVAENGYWHPSLPYEGTKEFTEAYTKRFQRAPSSDSAHAWIAVKVLEQAIASAGTLDQQKLNVALHSNKFTTIGGPYKYDEAGRNETEKGFLIQVVNGERTIVWPDAMATTPIRIPGLHP
jgi:branched-chain amino acid transport system substrate-binding protein